MGKRKNDFVQYSTTHDFVKYADVYKLKTENNTHVKDLLLKKLENKSACEKFNECQNECFCPIIHNMVTTMHIDNFGKKIDLNAIARCMGNSSYDRKRFAAITLRIKSPRTTALVFSSGKVVMTGATSKQMSLHAARGILCMLRRIFPFERFRQTKFSIQNIVCNVQIPRLKGINIDRMYSSLPSECTYQASIFPGLVYRPKGSPVVVLIFRSSRVVVTGAKKYDHVVSGFLKVINSIQPFFVY